MQKMVNEDKRITLSDAQKEMRSAFLGGFAGQFISGLIWLGSAAISDICKPQYGMAFLFFGCMGIFPLTQLMLRMMGRPAKVNRKNGLWGLGSQIAFTVPINFLLVGVTLLYRQMWFFPAAMIIVGSHYLPFITLYGMKMYVTLSALLILGGTGLALFGPPIFSLGGWLTGITLILFAFISRSVIRRNDKSDC